jgi:protein Mpv17
MVASALIVWKLGMDGDLMSLASAQSMITHIPQQLWMSTECAESAPIMTKAATSATVWPIGDIIAQKSTGTELGDIDRCGPGACYRWNWSRPSLALLVPY